MRKIYLLICMVSLLWTPYLISSQDNTTCTESIQLAIQTTSEACDGLGRNKACYGNKEIIVQSALPNTFTAVGDQMLVADITSMTLSPLDEITESWGVGLFKLVATNIDNTTPGQLVTMVAFGDTELIPTISNDIPDDFSDAEKIQSFTLQTGIGTTQCNQTPIDGVLIQSESGQVKVHFQLNTVDVILGSTLYVNTIANDAMYFYTLEGQASINLDNQIIVIPSGTFLRIGIDTHFLPTGEIGVPQVYESHLFDNLPLALLQDEVTLNTPEDVIQELLITQGLAFTLAMQTGEDEQTLEFDLTVTRPWVNTSIQLTQGQTITIKGSGMAKTCNHADCEPPYDQLASPLGLSGTECEDCLMSNVPEMLLIGKIGDNAPFSIGDEVTFTVKADGILYMAANDADYAYDDNEGIFNIEVIIQN